ncbi:coiled-coil domain-containing protein 82 [Erpetoichthys calabaricus]|uniref:Coiled-coil domain-containing protein 82-like n=1 Tax=Erpetoichthys calabaricus TaxID=27687 RepID=A0A8C4X6M1_ERPCA|nr:coiled-coil domain-containing protein 82 [Erpetoichthys calabaricus]
MATAGSSIIYQTRRRTNADKEARKSRIDRRRTRIGSLSLLQDSSDDTDVDLDSETSKDSAEKTASSSEGTEDDKAKVEESNGVGSDEEDVVHRSSRKRKSSAMLNENETESDSDDGPPVRKVAAKKCPSFFKDDSESSDDAEGHESPTFGIEKDIETKEKVSLKKKERYAKLQQLSEKRRSKDRRSTGTWQDPDDDFQENAILSSSSDDESEDSLKEFIVEDEDVEESNSHDFVKKHHSQPPERLFAEHHLSIFSLGSPYAYFQIVVKALLINAVDGTFLKSLYDGSRKKMYAKEMTRALHYFDDRFVVPRLQNLLQRSRWKERYKERVECYPEVKVINTGIKSDPCEACEMHKHTRYSVVLSGQLYDNKTMDNDDFLPNDVQDFSVGSVCAGRTKVYHKLKHFKYHLFKLCSSEIQFEDQCDEPVKDRVSRVFNDLENKGWIKEQFELFEDCQNDADFFQDEKLD